MKSIFFHLMTYDGLPDDFNQRYRSVWVDIPAELCDPQRVHRLYQDYLDQLEYADSLGFDAIGVNEHHGNGYGLMASPNMMAAALARRTSKSMLMVMGDSIPLYNPPVRVAEELAMVDVMSGGRLIAGFPTGSSQDTNFVYGIPPATTRERFLEGYRLVRRAWGSDEVFSFNGRFNKLRYVNCWVRPLQKPHPPIWCPGSGSLETFDFAVTEDIPYCFLSYFGADFAHKSLTRFWDRVEAAGLDDNPFRTGMVQMVLVADTDQEAERLYKKHLQYFAQRSMHIYPGFVEAPGYKSPESLHASLPPSGTEGGHRADSWVMAKSYEWKDFVDLGIVIAGSPATVREKLVAAGRRSRIGNWILLLHVGDMPKDLAMYNTKLYSEQVLPYVQKEWGEYEHRWWPQPIADAQPPVNSHLQEESA